jgi:hypothetical protein
MEEVLGSIPSTTREKQKEQNFAREPVMETRRQASAERLGGVAGKGLLQASRWAGVRAGAKDW